MVSQWWNWEKSKRDAIFWNRPCFSAARVLLSWGGWRSCLFGVFLGLGSDLCSLSSTCRYVCLRHLLLSGDPIGMPNTAPQIHIYKTPFWQETWMLACFGWFPGYSQRVSVIRAYEVIISITQESRPIDGQLNLIFKLIFKVVFCAWIGLTRFISVITPLGRGPYSHRNQIVHYYVGCIVCNCHCVTPAMKMWAYFFLPESCNQSSVFQEDG